MIKHIDLAESAIKPYTKWHYRPNLVMYVNDYHIIGANCFKGAEIDDSSFRSTYFDKVDFTRSHFCRCDFSDAEFRNVDFSNAMFLQCTFIGCSFKDCNFYSAFFLNHTIFYDCTFINCNLDYVSISITSAVSMSSFRVCSFEGIDTETMFDCTFREGCENIPYIPMACPDEGPFIGYKIALYFDKTNRVGFRNCIVTLEIPADAKRSSALGRKCRCNKAMIIGAEDFDTGDPLSMNDLITSRHDGAFTYKLGDEIVIDNFDENRWKECAPGFHFFMNKEEARRY